MSRVQLLGDAVLPHALERQLENLLDDGGAFRDQLDLARGAIQDAPAGDFGRHRRRGCLRTLRRPSFAHSTRLERAFLSGPDQSEAQRHDRHWVVLDGGEVVPALIGQRDQHDPSVHDGLDCGQRLPEPLSAHAIKVLDEQVGALLHEFRLHGREEGS